MKPVFLDAAAVAVAGMEGNTEKAEVVPMKRGRK